MQSDKLGDTCSYDIGLFSEHPSIPLYIATIMATTFFWAGVYCLILTIRHFQNKAPPGFWSKKILFVFMSLFCFGRFMYFFLTGLYFLIEDVDHVEITHIEEYFSLTFYHGSSTLFYTTFSILSLNWAQLFLYQYGIDKSQILRMLKIPTLGFISFNVLIISIQLLLLTIIFISLLVSPKYQALTGAIYLIQVVYHGILCFIIVLSFVLWTIYVSKKVWRGMIRKKIFQGSSRPLIGSAFIVCFLVGVKGLGNWTLAIMRGAKIRHNESFGEICRPTELFITAVACVLVDLLPLAIVIFIWRPPTTEVLQDLDRSAQIIQVEHDEKASLVSV